MFFFVFVFYAGRHHVQQYETIRRRDIYAYEFCHAQVRDRFVGHAGQRF